MHSPFVVKTTWRLELTTNVELSYVHSNIMQAVMIGVVEDASG